MNDSAQASAVGAKEKWMFWGCFIALITTAFAFITRAFLVNIPTLWPKDFGLDSVQGQELFGAGIWPFAISIIVFSLVIDKIGYRAAMFFSFICYGIYAAQGASGLLRHLATAWVCSDSRQAPPVASTLSWVARKASPLASTLAASSYSGCT